MCSVLYVSLLTKHVSSTKCKKGVLYRKYIVAVDIMYIQKVRMDRFSVNVLIVSQINSQI